MWKWNQTFLKPHIKMIDIPPCFYRISIKWVILDTEWKFLLCKESNGIWDFPGGGLEYKENPRDSLKREIQEEMWLTTLFISEHPLYFLTAISLSGKPIANIFYEARVKNLDFKISHECQEIWFFSIEEAKHLSIFPNVEEFLKIYTM